LPVDLQNVCFHKNQGKFNDFIVESMMNWHHSGFNAYCGKTIWPDNDEGLENKEKQSRAYRSELTM